MQNRIVFLGTGGGKNVMFHQVRRTGGIYISLDGNEVILDPGPGSLVNARLLKMKPENFSIALLSHNHPDHNTDMNVYLDGMKNPVLIAEKSCIKPSKDYYPCVSRHHQKLARTVVAKPGRKIEVNNLEIIPVKAAHYAPCVGFRINRSAGSASIGYTANGTYYKGQEKRYDGCDVLILDVLVPLGKEAQEGRHMSTEQAVVLISKMKKKPRLAIIQHFSFWMLQNNVHAQAGYIEKKTGVKTIAAEDFMEVDLSDFSVKNQGKNPQNSGRAGHFTAPKNIFQSYGKTPEIK